MNLTNFQKKIVKHLLKFNPEGVEYTLSTFIEHVFSIKELENIGLKIESDKIKFYVLEDVYGDKKANTKQHIEIRNKGYEVFKLFYKLISNNYFACIETKNDRIKDFKYRLKSEYNHEIIIPFDIIETYKIYAKLYNFTYISSDLKRYKSDKFKTKDELEIFYIRRTLWATVLISLFGMILQYYIAKNITTVIEFTKETKLFDGVIINLK